MSADGGGSGDGHGDGEDGVGSEFGFVLGAVDVYHGGVDEALVGGVHAREFGTENGLDVFYGVEDTFTEVVLLVSVTEFDGLVLSGRGSTGDGGAAFGSAIEQDVGFDGWIASGVEDFACVDRDDLSHVAPVCRLC